MGTDMTSDPGGEEEPSCPGACGLDAGGPQAFASAARHLREAVLGAPRTPRESRKAVCLSGAG